MGMIGFSKVNPRTIPWETNDCVVRATSVATGDSYELVHALYKALGRRNGKGTPVFLINLVLDKAEKMQYDDRHTLNKFIAAHPKGTFVCCSRRHAFAVIDGVVHDQGAVGGKTRVLWTWRIK